MAHTYSKRGATGGGSVVAAGKTNGGDSTTSKEEDYSPNHVVYKKVSSSPLLASRWRRLSVVTPGLLDSHCYSNIRPTTGTSAFKTPQK